MWNLFEIVNRILRAHREGNLIEEKIWQDRLDELNYIY